MFAVSRIATRFRLTSVLFFDAKNNLKIIVKKFGSIELITYL